ncbi:rhodanese-like domain-containing protein [Sinomonas humi]|uniref:Sulfurtransferase n=1 Tax=Sinomonas humi TaxID=1338436 RepID=A0A0B2ANU9_9MICC|nr:rhodanese-like domain-containing protein [Sinomonas humi]KHL03617.1 sulfurtransferase [Sinomonas humi]
MNSISVDDLAALGVDAAIVDVREADEYAEARVPGAKNVPLSRLAESTGDLPPHRPVYVMCASGGRSAQAAAFLAAQGFDAVNVLGGISEWHRSGHPVAFGPQGA